MRCIVVSLVASPGCLPAVGKLMSSAMLGSRLASLSGVVEVLATHNRPQDRSHDSPQDLVAVPRKPQVEADLRRRGWR